MGTRTSRFSLLSLFISYINVVFVIGEVGMFCANLTSGVDLHTQIHCGTIYVLKFYLLSQWAVSKWVQLRSVMLVVVSVA